MTTLEQVLTKPGLLKFPVLTDEHIALLNEYNIFTTQFPDEILHNFYNTIEYSSCYCEENIWCLCAFIYSIVMDKRVDFNPLFSTSDVYQQMSNEEQTAFILRYKIMILDQFYPLFLSSSKAVIVFAQQLSVPENNLTHWDYHVILLKRWRRALDPMDIHIVDLLQTNNNNNNNASSTKVAYYEDWHVFDFDTRL
eukprot:UN06912